MKSYYLTTAIDYANGSPSRHAYEKFPTDVIARSKRLLGTPVEIRDRIG